MNETSSVVAPTAVARSTEPATRQSSLFMSLTSFGCLGLWCLSLSLSAQTKPLYENNFEKAEVGKVPEDFLVLDGAFVVKEESDNRFLELPGAPLDSFALQFGPAVTSDVAVSARIRGTGKG